MTVTDNRQFEVLSGLLYDILTELKHINSTERTGAVSSVELKFLANGTPQPTVKVYAGSEPPVDEVLEAYGRTVREASARALTGWQETVDSLAEKKRIDAELREKVGAFGMPPRDAA